MSEASEKSVYEQIGGEPAMDAAVKLFYSKVLADDHIAHFFTGIDMEKQMLKQKRFLTMVTGGPNKYTDRSMRAAHRRLVKEQGLTDSHFDHVVNHLGATLAELGVPAALIKGVADAAESLRDDVLDR
ncbi:MAG: group 1 truncated hemoglobin [Myxococcales bacterium]|nr:group 1 truncated hemoglobin [Myxococcales bacterium]